jgi:D-threo-aldose 1-dehydrogenase
MDQAIDEAYPELSKIRDEGLVASIGVGTNSAKVGARFLRETDIDIAMVAGRYTLLDQVALEDFLPEALKRQVSVMGAGVFNSGVVLDPVPGATYNYETAPPEVVSRAQKIHDLIRPYGVSPAAVALQFPLRHPAIRAILVGVRTVQELEGNIEAFNSSLPEELFSDLESAGLIGSIQS